MNRRGFIGSILALGAAPAIVRADSLMRIVPVGTLVERVQFYQASRQDLSDLIWDISPEETPFVTRVGKKSQHEWTVLCT
jgi:hypothetical protein